MWVVRFARSAITAKEIVGYTYNDHGIPASLAGDRSVEGEFTLIDNANILDGSNSRV